MKKRSAPALAPVSRYHIEWLKLIQISSSFLTERQRAILLAKGLIEWEETAYKLTKRGKAYADGTIP